MSVLDVPKESLDPELWDIDEELPKLHSDVSFQIVHRLKTWWVSQDLPLEALKGIYLVGSEATVQYSPSSDIDITVVFDDEDIDQETLKEKAIESGLNGKPLEGTSHPVNYYFRPDEEPVVEADAIYDILQDVWIKTPPELPPLFDPRDYFREVVEYAKTVADRINQGFAELRHLLIDWQEDPEDSRLREATVTQVQNLVDILETLVERRHKAFEAQDIAIPFGFSRSWMPANVVYKYLEKYGYIEALRNLQSLLRATDSDFEPEELRQVLRSLAIKRTGQSVGRVVEQIVRDFQLPDKWWEDDELRELVEILATTLGKSAKEVEDYIAATFLQQVLQRIIETAAEWGLDDDWVYDPTWRRKMATYVGSITKIPPAEIQNIIKDHLMFEEESSYTQAFKEVKSWLNYPVRPVSASLEMSEKWYVYSQRTKH